MKHALLAHKIAILRDKNTSVALFRRTVHEIGLLLAYEASKDLPLQKIQVETPVSSATAHTLARTTVLVPILRAGLGLVDPFLTLLPDAQVGHLGMERDENTLVPREYYCKLPNNLSECDVLVLDPMLATGGSADDALTLLKSRGAARIRFVCIIAAPEGISLLSQKHPDVPVICAAVDEHLNKHGYIVPGLGDAGDRIFGTL
jgi:uracil phosphoribosyltransferase